MTTQSKSLLFWLAIFLMGAICSCSKHSSDNDNEDDTDDIEVLKTDEATVQKLLDKYDAEGWTKSDYANAINIIEELSDNYNKKIESLLKSCDTREEFENNAYRFKDNFYYADKLLRLLRKSDASEMGEHNYDRWLKFCDQSTGSDIRLSNAINEKFGSDNSADAGDDYYDKEAEAAPENSGYEYYGENDNQ